MNLSHGVYEKKKTQLASTKQINIFYDIKKKKKKKPSKVFIKLLITMNQTF